jgi:hypothetical protein
LAAIEPVKGLGVVEGSAGLSAPLTESGKARTRAGTVRLELNVKVKVRGEGALDGP